MDKAQIDIDSTYMKRINKAVDSMCETVGDTVKDTQDFREEITRNLVQSMKDLLNEGHDPERAYALTLERFGDFRDDPEIIMKKKGNRMLLCCAIFMFIVGTVLILMYQFQNQRVTTGLEQFKSKLISYYNNENQDLSTDLVVSRDIQMMAEDWIDEHPYAKEVFLKIQANSQQPTPKFMYEYPHFGYKDNISAFPLRNNHFQSDTVNGFIISSDNNEYILEGQLVIRSYKPVFVLYGAYFLIGYWLIFVLWFSSLIPFNQNKKTWIVIIFLFNVLGYLLFEFLKSGKKTHGV